ncbi:hypothetical protein [Streptomyces sp. NBC_00996]|uniref:hypothetical protein n=1 Tax=Streptomyces sp. NBC_00996 TaxID=2903710 RepID=UPI00386A3853|nr:hypothetical protein OG390_40300 [Streptomyces sp. NBC_00996]
MTLTRSGLLSAPALVLLAVAAAGCADPAADPRGGGPHPATSAKGYCPLPEERRSTPSPCITFDWNQRVAENHAYRSPLPITAGRKALAAPQ